MIGSRVWDPDALILAPEDIGRMLRKVVPAALHTSDFQDIPSWAVLSVGGEAS